MQIKRKALVVIVHQCSSFFELFNQCIKGRTKVTRLKQGTKYAYAVWDYLLFNLFDSIALFRLPVAKNFTQARLIA